MNKRITALVLLVLAGAIWWLSPRSNQPVKPKPGTSARNTAIRPPVADQSPAEIPPKPRMFKSKTYPPQTAEEVAMWDWWRAMRKADPKFEWKTPIEFYGKVMDQFDAPVSDAKVTLMWSAMGGTQGKETMTASDGKFDLTGASGKGVSVSVSKEGYDSPGEDARKSFEYAAFFQDDFHVPDPEQPVIFRLHKIMEAEPMYVFHAHGTINVDGTPLWLNVANGKAGASGDLAFKLTVGAGHSAYGSDYTLAMEAQGGAGFVLTQEKFAAAAPESDYQTSFALTQKVDSPTYQAAQKFTFFAKTSAGKYAKVRVEIFVRPAGEPTDFNATISYNPSGSRNLEFDPKKWLNR
jgi:hypothetical protein